MLCVLANLCFWRSSTFTWPSRCWTVCSPTRWLASISRFRFFRYATLGLACSRLGLHFALHRIDVLHSFCFLLVWLLFLSFTFLWLLFLFTFRLHDVVHQVLEIFIVDLFVSKLKLINLLLELFIGGNVSSLSISSLPFRIEIKMVYHTIDRKTTALTLATFDVRVVLKWFTIVEVLCTGVARLCILGVVLHLVIDLLVSFIELLLLLHQLNLLTGVLIQIKLQIRLLLEIFVRVW